MNSKKTFWIFTLKIIDDISIVSNKSGRDINWQLIQICSASKSKKTFTNFRFDTIPFLTER